MSNYDDTKPHNVNVPNVKTDAPQTSQTPTPSHVSAPSSTAPHVPTPTPPPVKPITPLTDAQKDADAKPKGGHDSSGRPR
jgi:hypothetical protein